ncbi:MAG: hypothetical protein VX587_01055 [Thermoproteota archaeon]|nr:hypothetical protein [Thermoproteota archaeon]
MTKKEKSTKTVRKKNNSSKFLAIAITVIIIGIAIYYFYSADQAKIRGFTFGNEIQTLQQEIHDEQNRFISSIAKWEEGTIRDEEMIRVGESHIEEYKILLEKYDDLQPPDAFARSLKLFKLSLEYQIESHEHRLEWIKTNDELELIRSSELTQLSFESEQAGLKAFNDAKEGKKEVVSLQQQLTKEQYDIAKNTVLDVYRYQEGGCINSLGPPFEDTEQKSEFEDCMKYVEQNKKLELKNLEDRCCV